MIERTPTQTLKEAQGSCRTLFFTNGSRRTLLCCLFTFFLSPLSAQNIEWQQNYGGSSRDFAQSIVETSDGGFAVLGGSSSSDGDLGGNQGGYDCWVLKLDANGGIEWEQNYGGEGSELAHSIVQTADSGFAIAGSSDSADGDVGGNQGNNDCWVLKLDANGGIEWEQNYGGGGDEFAYSIVQTSDGGFAVAGYSDSADGDVGGNQGGLDVWALKLDANGGIEWEENYGGGGDESASSILQTSDGGFAVAGTSDSADGDVGGNQGNNDYWVLKLDGNGGIEWEENYGSSAKEYSNSIVQTSDGGFAVSGYSDTGAIDFLNPGDDVWALKLDGNGGIEWEEKFGGAGQEFAASIVQTSDGGFAIAGHSDSADGDVGGNRGGDDHWVLKLDGNGGIEWEENYGGSKRDGAGSIVQTSDGGFAVAGGSESADGDVAGNKGFSDYWVLKLGAQSTALEEGSVGEQNFSVHPNPTSEQIRIELGAPNSASRVFLRDLTGRTLQSKPISGSQNIKMDIDGEAGMYLIEIRAKDGRKEIKKVIKE